MGHLIWVYKFVINTGGRGIGIRVSISMSQSRNLVTQSVNYVGCEWVQHTDITPDLIMGMTTFGEMEYDHFIRSLALQTPEYIYNNEWSAHNFICRGGMWWEGDKLRPGAGDDSWPRARCGGPGWWPVSSVWCCDTSWHAAGAECSGENVGHRVDY